MFAQQLLQFYTILFEMFLMFLLNSMEIHFCKTEPRIQFSEKVFFLCFVNFDILTYLFCVINYLNMLVQCMFPFVDHFVLPSKAICTIW